MPNEATTPPYLYWRGERVRVFGQLVGVVENACQGEKISTPWVHVELEAGGTWNGHPKFVEPWLGRGWQWGDSPSSLPCTAHGPEGALIDIRQLNGEDCLYQENCFHGGIPVHVAKAILRNYERRQAEHQEQA